MRILLEGPGYDLVVLDVMLPKRDGFDVLKTLRQRRVQTPVLCLTARDAVSDKVAGLDLGADDYLTKPFAFEEFLARVRALLRRGTAQRVWGLDFDPESNIIDVYVGYVRRKIDGDGERRLLHTVRGAGYMLSAEA